MREFDESSLKMKLVVKESLTTVLDDKNCYRKEHHKKLSGYLLMI